MTVGMRLPDPGNSRALLLGCGSYADPSLTPLPSITRNLAGMKDILTSPSGTGLAPKHCVALEEANHVPAEIGSRLTVLAAEAEDMLLVYYAGHGLVGPNGELFLALPGTRSDYDLVAWTALPFGLLRSALAGARARNRVLILDCCFSGRAIDLMTEVTSAVSGQLEIAGSCTLTSSPANRPAIAPPGAKYTAYTGELLHFLRNGSTDEPELLTLTAIHQHLVHALRSQELPEPEQRNIGTIGQLALAPNRPRIPLPAVPDADAANPPVTTSRHSKRPFMLAGGVAAVVAAIAALLAYLLPGTSRPPTGTKKITVSNIAIATGQLPRGIAVDPDTHTAYIANYRSNTVSVVNTVTNEIIHTINTGTPNAVAINPAAHVAYVTNSVGDTVSVINTLTNKIIHTINTGEIPATVALDCSTRSACTAYISNYTDTVSVINITSSKLTDTINLSNSANAVAIDPGTHTAYAINSSYNNVSVIDTTANKAIGTISVGKSPDHVVFAPGAIAIDPATHTAYATNTDGNAISIINTTTNNVTATVKVGESPDAVAIDPDTDTAYIANHDSNSVSVINTTNNSVTATVKVGEGPDAIAIDPATHAAYVTNGGDNTVSIIKPG